MVLLAELYYISPICASQIWSRYTKSKYSKELAEFDENKNQQKKKKKKGKGNWHSCKESRKVCVRPCVDMTF